MPNILESRLRNRFGLDKIEAKRIANLAREQLSLPNVVWSKKLERECLNIFQAEKQAVEDRKKAVIEKRQQWRAEQRNLILQRALDLAQATQPCDLESESDVSYAPYVIDYKSKVTFQETIQHSDDEDTISVGSEDSYPSWDEEECEMPAEHFLKYEMTGRTLILESDNAAGLPNRKSASFKNNLTWQRIRSKGCRSDIDYQQSTVSPISKSRWAPQARVGSSRSHSMTPKVIQLSIPQRKSSDDDMSPLIQTLTIAPKCPVRTSLLEQSKSIALSTAHNRGAGIQHAL